MFPRSFIDNPAIKLDQVQYVQWWLSFSVAMTKYTTADGLRSAAIETESLEAALFSVIARIFLFSR